MEATRQGFLGGAMVSPQRAAGRPALMPDRDPVIDLARFFCLLLVVVGHTMMVSPVLHPDGTVTSENTLGNQRWFEPVVWVLQIMPLFFVAGGITGLQSWRRLRARGGNAFDFMQGRLLRLIRPATVLLAVMFAGLSLALLSGVDPQVIQLLTSGAGMPLWFLAAYLAAQLNLPWLAALHGRAPWLTLAGLTSLVVAVDCLRGVLPMLAYLNMVFLWCAVQQIGFIVADSRPLHPSRPALFGIIVASNALLGLLVLLGLYSGNMLVNLNPPNVTLLLLAISQAAVLELLRPLLARTASLAWVRRVVGVAGRRSMTVYLWHLPLLAAMSGLLLLTDLPKPAGGTAEWWWARPVVLLGVIALLLPVLALFGRLEERPMAPGPAPSRPAAAVLLAAVAVFVPAVQAALNGLTLGLLGGGAACFALAVVLLGRIPARLTASADRPGGSEPPLPRPPLSANVEP
ncbi:acyltransferase-like protein [Arthrobacter oryzae]|uniref:Acyltransferase-like protein n=2 Tax=Arthrobacter oryzae TaxID=409290 RepID=A0A495ETF9_9MICC|nr:acyltransferase-like protein [Arthrobacter oryzae]